MMKKTSLVLAVLAILLFQEIKGNPLIEAETTMDPKTLASSRILPRTDWLNFHNTWTLDSIPYYTSIFSGEDKQAKEAGLLKKRIDALEQSQKDIIKMLKKITQDIKSNASPSVNKKPNFVLPEKPNEEPILPAKPAHNEKDKPKVTEKPAFTENPAPATFAKPDLPNDDKKDDNSAIKEVPIQEKTITKMEFALEGKEEQLEDPNGNIELASLIPQSSIGMNDRMPSVDDVASP